MNGGIDGPDWSPAHSLAEGPEAVLTYLRETVLPCESDVPNEWGDAEVTYLDVGVMNYVYRVDVPSGSLFLKQALSRVKEHTRLGKDLSEVSPARIQVEARALRALRTGLPEPLRRKVPRVVHYDERNNVLWTLRIGERTTSLQSALQKSLCDPQVACRLGRLLGVVHGVPLESEPLWPTREQDRANWLRFLRMRTTGVLSRAELPAQAAMLTQELYEEARACECLGMISHLDAAPKNVRVGTEGEVFLLDFELGAAVSDPAYDPGFLAGHYLLMGENDPTMRAAARSAAAAIESGYRETAPALDARWSTRFRRYAALTMLYRLYGSSPAPYLNPDRYPKIRTSALRLLLEPDTG